MRGWRLARGSWIGPAIVAGALALLGVAAWAPGVGATPPEYTTFGREQQIDHEPVVADLLRIWMIYVDQGDGLLIQLPERFAYDPDPGDGDPTRSERIDVLVDGGSNPSSESWRALQFLEKLYPGETRTIEHAIVTHHDSDHVYGLIDVLDDPTVAVEHVYHNGLATWEPGHKAGFRRDRRPENAVYVWNSGQSRLERGMALLEPDGERMQRAYLIGSLAELRTAFANGELGIVYEPLAQAIVGKERPAPVQEFHQAGEGRPFVGQVEAGRSRPSPLGGAIGFEVLWPRDPPRRYGNWGETINGNSVTFRLTYGDFQILFTGDLNELSEEDMLEHLGPARAPAELGCDVLKTPHHGSSHAFQKFFTGGGCSPVVAVASMGEQGFRSKRLGQSNWQHPSTDVIEWLGGAHRVYHTLIHERRFRWEDLSTPAKHQAMYEYSHVLVETDGTWFRVVEIDDVPGDPRLIPTVRETRRGNGTRWIRAR